VSLFHVDSKTDITGMIFLLPDEKYCNTDDCDQRSDNASHARLLFVDDIEDRDHHNRHQGHKRRCDARLGMSDGDHRKPDAQERAADRAGENGFCHSFSDETTLLVFFSKTAINQMMTVAVIILINVAESGFSSFPFGPDDLTIPILEITSPNPCDIEAIIPVAMPILFSLGVIGVSLVLFSCSRRTSATPVIVTAIPSNPEPLSFSLMMT
jgi:hypothetical protein